jgi:hypothetical protein
MESLGMQSAREASYTEMEPTEVAMPSVYSSRITASKTDHYDAFTVGEVSK